MRLDVYSVLSVVALAGSMLYAYDSRRGDFYTSAIFMSNNKFCLVILGNMALVSTFLVGRTVRRIFLGSLRDMELEILYENSRFAVTETCMALTIFREELSPWVLAFFTLLFFCKAFHWLAHARVEHVEQLGTHSTPSAVRLVCLLLLCLLVDVSVVNSCVVMLLAQRPSVLILFAFEFSILAVSAASTFARYLLHLVDARIDGTWHSKNSYMFLLEFVTEVLRFFFYVVFFGIVFTYYGMPLHIVRDLWVSYTNLRRRLQTYNRYRTLTANMNERFPDATAEELEACEHTCIICRDSMEEGKKLPCSHIFHFHCLRLWLQHQQTCPTCRADISASEPIPAAAAAAAVAAAPVAEAAEARAAAGVGGGPAAEAEGLQPPGGDGRQEHQEQQPGEQHVVAAAAAVAGAAAPAPAPAAPAAAAPAVGEGAAWPPRQQQQHRGGAGESHGPKGSSLERETRGRRCLPATWPAVVRIVAERGAVVREQPHSLSKGLRTVPSGSYLCVLNRLGECLASASGATSSRHSPSSWSSPIPDKKSNVSAFWQTVDGWVEEGGERLWWSQYSTLSFRRGLWKVL